MPPPPNACRQAGGMDGIEIQAYGHLIDQFWSPLSNKLSGPYGADTMENRLRAAIGTDYSDRVTHAEYDQVVVNYGTTPLDDLYHALRPASSNGGAVDQEAFICAHPQTMVRNPDGAFQLFRIGDAVSARNTHAAIYDAVRLMVAV